MKFINCHTNHKFPGNDGLTTEFYIHFSNELAPLLLDVYDSWWKVGTMGFTSSAGIIFAIHRKGDEKDIENYGPVALLKLRL